MFLYKVCSGLFTYSYEWSKKTRACRRVPLDAYRWTPEGDTNALSTLHVQKAYEFVGDTVSVFCGRRVKISIIHNYNLTENFGAVGINFRIRGGGGVNLPNSGGGEVKFPIFHKKPYTYPKFSIVF